MIFSLRYLRSSQTFFKIFFYKILFAAVYYPRRILPPGYNTPRYITAPKIYRIYDISYRLYVYMIYVYMLYDISYSVRVCTTTSSYVSASKMITVTGRLRRRESPLPGSTGAKTIMHAFATET